VRIASKSFCIDDLTDQSIDRHYRKLMRDFETNAEYQRGLDWAAADFVSTEPQQLRSVIPNAIDRGNPL
jgi:hypothetical protein